MYFLLGLAVGGAKSSGEVVLANELSFIAFVAVYVIFVGVALSIYIKSRDKA